MGYYFTTICTKNHLCYFGDIVDDEMMLNDIGEIAIKYWLEIPKHFNNVILDEFTVMPNHVHGILIINGNNNCRDVACNVSTDNTTETNFMSQISPKPLSLSTIIRSYKSAVTKTINQKHEHGYFAWQPRFYDHIICNEQSFHNIRQYIINNPLMWNRDRNNPEGLLI